MSLPFKWFGLREDHGLQPRRRSLSDFPYGRNAGCDRGEPFFCRYSGNDGEPLANQFRSMCITGRGQKRKQGGRGHRLSLSTALVIFVVVNARTT
jgi:hypothetical protein